MTTDGPALNDLPLHGGAVLESPSGAAVELRWLTYGAVADSELIERAGVASAISVDPNLADIAASALGQVTADLARQGVALRFSVEHRSNRPDEVGSALAATAGLGSTTQLIQHRSRLDAGEGAGPAPDSLTVRPVADGDDWEPLARLHGSALSETFLRSPDTAEGMRARLAGSRKDRFTVHVVEDPEVSGRYVGMIATAVYRSTPSSPAIGELSLLAVDPDHRKRGLGRFLVAHARAVLAAEGARTAMAYVEADNEPATNLLADQGFKPRATRTYHSA